MQLSKKLSAKNSKRNTQILLIVLLALMSLTTVIPFIWMISTSFDSSAILDVAFPPSLLPHTPSLQAYEMTFRNIPMMKYMMNSFVIATGVIFVSLFSALSSGYALSKIHFKGHKAILLIALMTLMVPVEVTMIPQFFLLRKLKLINSYMAFYLPATVYVFGTFFAKQFIDTLPDSFRESAMLDGAGEFRTAFQIYIPLCMPLVATLAVLLFLTSWNDFLWPLIVLTKDDKYTVQIGMAMFTYQRGEQEMPALRMASAVISILPVMLIYLSLQRFIVESIALSGVKQ